MTYKCSLGLLAILFCMSCGEAEVAGPAEPLEVEEALTYVVGGEVTGLLGEGLTLLLNDEFELAVLADGGFRFEDAPLESGESFELLVMVQPQVPAQFCEIDAASGVVLDTDITTIAIVCRPRQYRIGGILSGLVGEGLELTLNGSWTLEPSEDGDITFHDGFLDDGTAFEVELVSEPTNPSQTCSLSGESGTITAADVVDLRVNCQTDRFLVGGSVEGLRGEGLTLELNGSASLPIEANGTFVFEDSAIEDGRLFEVSVSTQPTEPVQVCELGLTGGMIVGEDVTDLLVTCLESANDPDQPFEESN